MLDFLEDKLLIRKAMRRANRKILRCKHRSRLTKKLPYHRLLKLNEVAGPHAEGRVIYLLKCTACGRTFLRRAGGCTHH